MSPYFRTAQHKADFECISKLINKNKTQPLSHDEKIVVGIIGRRAPEPFRSQFLAIYDDLMAKEPA